MLSILGYIKSESYCTGGIYKKTELESFTVLSGLWVLQEKVDTRVSTFSLPNHFLFLGIYGIIELSKDERR